MGEETICQDDQKELYLTIKDMFIVQIGQYPLNPDLIRGGVESSVFGLAAEQAKSHTVVVLDIPRLGGVDSIEREDNLTIYRFQNRGTHQKDAVTRVPEILSIINHLHPSVCHLHGTSPLNWKIFKALERRGIPVIVTVHGLVSVEKKKSLREHFSLKTCYQYIVQSSAERKLLSASGEIIVDTKYVEDEIRHYHLASNPHMTVIPQGINDSFFGLSCSRDSRMVLSVGAFSQRKGHLFLIRSFEMICARIPDVQLTICGIITDAAYYSAIQEHLSSSPYADRISIHTDVPKEVLLDLYQKAHVFALHSQEESQGIVFAEAMAAGLPVVSTRVGGVPYVVSEGITGFLADYGDVPSFATALESLFICPEKWSMMSQECHEKSLSYSWESISESIFNAYQSLF